MTIMKLHNDNLNRMCASFAITRRPPPWIIFKLLGDADWVLRWFGESDESLRKRSVEFMSLSRLSSRYAGESWLHWVWRRLTR